MTSLTLNGEGGEDGDVASPPHSAVPVSAVVGISAARSPDVRLLALVPLAVLLALYLYTVSSAPFLTGGPAGIGLGSDYAMFYAAAKLVHVGGNPYAHDTLFNTERATLAAQHVPTTDLSGWVRVGNPPLLFWGIEPLASLPFRPSAWLWLGAMFLCSIVGLLCTLRALGWTQPVIGLMFSLAMPQTVIGVFNGNPVSAVFAGLGGSLLLLVRRPGLAGAVATLAWLKPTVALPFVGLMVVFLAPRPLRFLAGFGGATLTAALLTGLLLGPHIFPEWLHGLMGYSRDMRYQLEMAPLSAIYANRVPYGVRELLQATSLALALVVTIIAWLRMRRRLPVGVSDIAWLWVLWYLLIPYAHVNDTILIAAPVLALVGPNGSRLPRPVAVLPLYLIFAAVLSVSIGPFPFEPFGLAAVELCVLWWTVHGDAGTGTTRPHAPVAGLTSSSTRGER